MRRGCCEAGKVSFTKLGYAAAMDIDHHKLDPLVDEAARRIIDAMKTLVRKLPDSVAPEYALELVGATLAERESDLTRWLVQYTHNCDALLDNDTRGSLATRDAVRRVLKSNRG